MSRPDQKTLSRWIRERKWEAVAEELQRRIAEEPPKARALAQLGYCQFQLGDIASAAKSFESATLVDTSHWQAGRMHAECLDRLGQYDEALRVAELWLQKAPNSRSLRRLVQSLGRIVRDPRGAWQSTINCMVSPTIDLKGPADD